MRTHQGALLALTLSAFSLPAVSLAQDGFGGARDIGLVRRQVSVGLVPPPEAYTVEGMLAEHHFPVRPERCPERFCVFTAMGHGLHRADNSRSAYLLVEPVAGIDPARHQRAPLNLAVVLDRSGSMTGWKFSSAVSALHALIDRLGPRDRLAIVTFDQQATLVRPSTPVSNRAALHRAVDTIRLGGSTNIAAGLRLGFEQVAAGAGREGVSDRVFILTDEQPNVGATDPGSFQELVGHFAARHIGLTVVGVGLDLGAELARRTAELEGGSYHYLESAEAVGRLFGEDFDANVTPVATHLAVHVRPGPGLRVAEVLGVPGDDVVSDGAGGVTLRAATVFLDRRRSGAVVRLEPVGDAGAVLHASATVDWRYTRPGSGEETQGRSEALHVARSPTSLMEFDLPDHYRAYALVNFARGLRSSLELWHRGELDLARQTLGAVRAGLQQDVQILEDGQLQAERELADRLLVNMDRYVAARRQGVEVVFVR